MILNKTDSQILAIQDKNIEDCKTFRQEWSRNAAHVDLAIKGIIYPSYHSIKNTYRNNKNKEVVLTLTERQYRNMLNYISGNKPSISARKTLDMSDEELEKSKILIKGDFIESDFYLNNMDEIIIYGFKRGIVYTLCLMGEDGRVTTKITDSMDTYVDTRANKKEDIKHIIYTFTKTKEEVKNEFPMDYKGEILEWDKIQDEVSKTLNDEKRNIIKEPQNTEIVLFREGWYIDYENGKPILIKLLSIRDRIIKLEKFPEYDFLPVTYFAPINEPDEIYPRSRFKSMLALERKANDILNKFLHITDIGGRQVFIREGTRISKGSNKLINSLGIEIIEIGKSQDIPAPVELLKISQADMALFNIVIAQAEESGGIRQDAMGKTSLGADASGQAIAEQKAASYANVGVTVNELNKFMNRLGQIYFKLYKQGGKKKIKYYDSKTDLEVEIETSKLAIPLMHIEPKSSFDNIAEKIDAIEMLKQILATNPDAKVSPEIWSEVYGQKNDLGKRLVSEMNKQKDPNIKAAEASIQLLLAGQEPAVSPTDDHTIHIALLTKLLGEAGKQLPPQIQKNIMTKYNKHKAFAGGDPAEDSHRQEK